MKIFLSAYACEPNRGSEQGVGWKWLLGLSGRVSLTVLTRKSKQKSIEKEISKTHVEHVLRKVNFIYYDLPRPFLWAKRKGILPTFAYYVLWQWSASHKFVKIADQTDIVHHLTFCNLLCPGFWKLKSARFVLGPVGAPIVNSHYYPLFGIKSSIQRLRGWLMKNFLYLPSLRRSLLSAYAVIPANNETRGLLISKGIVTQEVILDTGAPIIPDPEPSQQGNVKEKCHFIFAGSLERRKGLELSLRAFAKAIGNIAFKGHFIIVGNGPDRNRLQKISKLLGIEQYVEFAGRMNQVDVLREFRKADVFLFSSVRDTSAGVNLEAMACGLPIVCLSHQGVADITTDSCALRVSPGPIDETIEKLSAAIQQISSNHELKLELGKGAKRRASQDFSWDSKFEKMIKIYESVIKEHRSTRL